MTTFCAQTGHTPPTYQEQPAPILDDAADLPPRPTWSDLYQLFRRRRLVERQQPARTVEAYDELNRIWRQIMGNPPVADITEATLRRFALGLAARQWRGRPIAATTQAKHLKTLSAVLKYAGPRLGKHRTVSRRGLFGLDPETNTPQPPPILACDDWPRTTTRTRPDLEFHEIGEWIDAAQDSIKPKIRGVADCADWWGCLIVFLRNTGLRIESALLAEWSMFDGHWLHLPPWAMKGKRHGATIYCNPWAMAAALKIRTDSPRVFSWYWTLGWYKALAETAGRMGWTKAQRSNGKTYYKRDRRAVILPAKMRAHALRRTLLSELSAINHTAAQFQAGHLHGDVLSRYYAQARKHLPALLDDPQLIRQPEPKLWTPPPPVTIRGTLARDNRQRLLFD